MNDDEWLTEPIPEDDRLICCPECGSVFSAEDHTVLQSATSRPHPNCTDPECVGAPCLGCISEELS